MAVGLKAAKGLLPIGGLELASGYAGIRKAEQDDVVVMRFAEESSVAATFTRNAFCAAPVLVAKRHLERKPQALVINAGNANAGTGSAGLQNAYQSCDNLAQALSIDPEQVLTFSTGVIFEPLPIEKLNTTATALCAELDADRWDQASRAIMTTDTVPKGVSKQVELSFGTASMTGIVKGSGMIRPNMATMLAFIATDVAVEPAALDALLHSAVDASFNSITVDSDTSTNDSCVLIATGAWQNTPLNPSSQDWHKFSKMVHDTLIELAHNLVRDAEGATKFITVRVNGGRSVEESRTVAFEIAHSPLVKTAFYGSDPNLGRLLMAIGKSPIEALDVDLVNLWLGNIWVVKDGQPHPDYDEAIAASAMAQADIEIKVSLGRGNQDAVVWTCDLSHDYITINADYRS